MRSVFIGGAFMRRAVLTGGGEGGGRWFDLGSRLLGKSRNPAETRGWEVSGY